MRVQSRYRTIAILPCAVCRTNDAAICRKDQTPLCSRRCEIRRANLLRCYGLTPAEFWALFEAQRGVCAMPECETELVYDASVGTRQQVVQIDHDPRSGKVRGLLCARCNRNLGGYEAIIGLGVETYLASDSATRLLNDHRRAARPSPNAGAHEWLAEWDRRRDARRAKRQP